MDKKSRAAAIVAALAELYPAAACSLDYSEAWQLLFSARLSAQCTDARVNIVARELYEKYPSPEALAAADISELEAVVRPCGLYHVKARDLKAGAAMLSEKFGGLVPDTREELLLLPGVGRKIANLILGDVYGKPAIIADTHCIRLSNRFGLCESTDPYKVELSLTELIEPDEQNMYSHRCVWHGRAVCSARSPACRDCALRGICVYGGKA